MPRHGWAEDLDGSGSVTQADRDIGGTCDAGAIMGDTGYNILVDLDFSGDLDSGEVARCEWSSNAAALDAGAISDPDFDSGPSAGYDGYFCYDITDLSCVCFRWYDAGLGRWMARDPAGRHASDSLYSSFTSSPMGSLDVSGLSTQTYERSDLGGRPLQDRLEECDGQCRNFERPPNLGGGPQVIEPPQSTWIVDADAIARCESRCRAVVLHTPILQCNRDRDARGAGCVNSCLFWIADFFESHGYLVTNPVRDTSWAIHGRERRGDGPTQEVGFPGAAPTCVSCTRTAGTVRGTGKSGYEATLAEIERCIADTTMQRDYDAFTDNCKQWMREAMQACGIQCGVDRKQTPDYVTVYWGQDAAQSAQCISRRERNVYRGWQ